MRHASAAPAFALLLLVAQVCWSATKPVKSAVHKAKKAPAVSHVKSTTTKEPDTTTTTATGGDSTAHDTAAAAKKSAKREPTADDFRKQGDQFARKGQSKKAMDAYRKCLEMSGEDDTANGRIFLSLGKYYHGKKEYKEALQYFSKAKGKATERLAFKIVLAEALQQTGKNDSAIGLLEPFAANPKLATKLNKGMFKILGDAYFKSDSTAKAVKWYGKYLMLGGVKTADMAYLIASYKEETVPAKAKPAYQANIKSYPNDYRNFLRLGKMQAKSRATLQSALGLFKKAASLTDTVPSIWIEIGKVNASLGKRDDELEAYRTCLRADSANLDAKIRIGTALLDRGSTEDAIAYLEKAHKQAPDSSGPMVALSYAYVKTGKSKKAIELLEKIKAVQPKNLEVRKQLVGAYEATGQDQKALGEINGALEVERDYELLLAGGKLMVKMGKFDDAVMMLEEVLGTMPESIDALMLMATAKRGQQKPDEAVEVYKEISVLDPKYAPALYERAEVHLEQQKAQWADMFYKRALAADSQFALAEVGLAKLELLYKKRDACEAHLAKASSMAPGDPVVQKAIDDVRNPKKPSATGENVKSAAAASDDGNAAPRDEGRKKEKKKRRK
ncbi:MAG: tetratricopeptide repeat protein [Chitinispirillaceae bacterium]|nr:tetratricopeptide repeat protein [Chitinispirillaceae bacterium]